MVDRSPVNTQHTVNNHVMICPACTWKTPLPLTHLYGLDQGNDADWPETEEDGEDGHDQVVIRRRTAGPDIGWSHLHTCTRPYGHSLMICITNDV